MTTTISGNLEFIQGVALLPSFIYANQIHQPIWNKIMNDYDIENPTTVTRKLIPESQRLSHTAKLFGASFPMLFEPLVYQITGRMAKQYSGGYWLFYKLSNGGFYMAPDDDRVFSVSCDNCYSGELSAHALGIVACLYAYSHLSFGGNGAFPRECARQYHLLRYYMCDHTEVASILGAIV